MENEYIIFLIVSLFIGFTYGVIAQRKQFCFSGGIKDLILFSHTRRTASLIVAIATVILFTQTFSYIYNIDLSASKYYININYLFIILGGLMFGYGMMVADGCSSRHLIKLAQGEKESFYILISLAIFAYITYNLFQSFYASIYENIIVSYTTFESSFQIPYILAFILISFLLYKSLNRCMNIFQCWDGFSIGVLISLTWVFTSVVAVELFLDVKAQSLSFVYPLGKITEGFVTLNEEVINFGVLTVIGVLIGAFISSKFNSQYSKKQMCDNSQQNPPILIKKIVGGAFMGVGGILAVGCTVGQGLSGISTLSFASFLAIASIYVSAYFTAKKMKKDNALIACFVFDFDVKK